MASINGVEIKGLKFFKGHDGESYAQGNVYLDGKRLGFWSQDAWCGPDRFEFDKNLLTKACLDFQAGTESACQLPKAKALGLVALTRKS